jgi:hypothetical protein
MNERIRELVRQAGLDDADFPIENWDNVPLAKFAELIVRECVLVINTEAGEREDDDEIERAWKMGTEFAVYQIKQHFGVEE